MAGRTGILASSLCRLAVRRYAIVPRGPGSAPAFKRTHAGPVSAAIARHPVTARTAGAALPLDHRVRVMPPVTARSTAAAADLPAEDAARMDRERQRPQAGGGLLVIGVLRVRGVSGHDS